MNSNPKNPYHKAIDRFERLVELARSREFDTSYKLAKASGIPQSVAYRQIAVLEELRILSRDMHGRFMIGSETLRLSNQAWQVRDVDVLAEPILRFVRIQTRKTAFLGFVSENAVQLGLYSIGLGSRFKRPTQTGRYQLRNPKTPLVTGPYSFVDEEGGQHWTVLSPVSGNHGQELVIGLFETTRKEAAITDDLALVTDAAMRLRAGMTLVSQTNNA